MRAVPRLTEYYESVIEDFQQRRRGRSLPRESRKVPQRAELVAEVTS